MVHVVMPQFGETVAEGELTRWLVSVGETVVVDQPIAEISTDKVDTEVVASDAGQVTALLGRGRARSSLSGRPSCELDGPGWCGGYGNRRAAGDRPAADRAPRLLRRRSARRRSTPKARRIARELGIDIAELSSASRVVHADDVVAAVAASPPATPGAAVAVQPGPVIDRPAAGTGQYLIQHSRIRRITASGLDSPCRPRRPRGASPRSTTATSMSRARALSAAWKRRHGSSLTYLPYVLRAVSLALLQYPRLNAEYREDGLLVSESVNIGIAVDLGDGGTERPRPARRCEPERRQMQRSN